MGAKWNFRRIELALVLVTVGLLLAGLGAVGKTSRERAQGVVCLANLGQLTKGWHKFAEDHDGLLVGGCTTIEWQSSMDSLWKDRWVERPKRTPVYAGDPPMEPNNDYVDKNTVTQTYREYGIMAGRLWPYVKNINAYHCPADPRLYDDSYPHKIFRSYEISGTMRGEEIFESYIDAFQKFHQIDQPETKLVFIEEAIRNQWYITGSWLIEIIIETGHIDYERCKWTDPMSNFHGNNGTLSFADGHAILKKWEDQFTVDLNETGRVGGYPPDGEKTDITFMARSYGGLWR
jgi:prepilin-type processing-associated H-X9-DG protein